MELDLRDKNTYRHVINNPRLFDCSRETGTKSSMGFAMAALLCLFFLFMFIEHVCLNFKHIFFCIIKNDIYIYICFTSCSFLLRHAGCQPEIRASTGVVAPGLWFHNLRVNRRLEEIRTLLVVVVVGCGYGGPGDVVVTVALGVVMVMVVGMSLITASATWWLEPRSLFGVLRCFTFVYCESHNKKAIEHHPPLSIIKQDRQVWRIIYDYPSLIIY